MARPASSGLYLGNEYKILLLVVAGLNPNWLQTTLASLLFQVTSRPAHTVPHLLLMHISTRPQIWRPTSQSDITVSQIRWSLLAKISCENSGYGHDWKHLFFLLFKGWKITCVFLLKVMFALLPGQITPASWLCWQLCCPITLSLTHSRRIDSFPIHWTLSRNMGPLPSPKKALTVAREPIKMNWDYQRKPIFAHKNNCLLRMHTLCLHIPAVYRLLLHLCHSNCHHRLSPSDH